MENTCDIKRDSHVFLIKKITASGRENDTNHEKGVLDTSYESIWTCKGKGSFLVLEPDYADPQAEGRSINQIRVAFGKGFERIAYLEVQESTDGKEYKGITKPLASSGKTDGLELYNLSRETKAANIKIVFNGNTKNDWNNVHTVQLVNDPNWKADVIIPPPVIVPPVPPVEPPVTPPGGDTGTSYQVSKDGVQVPVPKGFKLTKFAYEPRVNARDDGIRLDFNGIGSSFKNIVYVLYMALTSPVKDEKSGKLRGGKHSDGLSPKVFDMGIDLISGENRYRTEDKHPEYEKGATGKNKCKPQGKEYIGNAFVCYNSPDNKTIILQIYEDAGNNESKPSNAWKLIDEFVVTQPLWLVPPSDHMATARIDDPNKKGMKELQWKWVCIGELTPV